MLGFLDLFLVLPGFFGVLIIGVIFVFFCFFLVFLIGCSMSFLVGVCRFQCLKRFHRFFCMFSYYLYLFICCVFCVFCGFLLGFDGLLLFSMRVFRCLCFLNLL